jgi:hypothetical protein
MSGGRRLAAALLCLSLAACARQIPHSQASVDALAQAVLDAVAARDETALRRLALDEQEFREHVWPELPASRPERNLPFSFVWGDLRTKSDAGLAAMLRDHGGRRYRLERVRFGGGITQYQSSVVHRESTLEVRGPDGERDTIQLFGSVIQKAGGFKVFSYVVD